MFSADRSGSMPARKLDLPRLRALLLSSGLIGIALVAAIWTGVGYHLSSVRERTVQATTQDVNNLAHVFEQELIRTLREADRALVSLRTSYHAGTFYFDLSRRAADAQFLADSSFQVFLMDSEGIIRASSLGPMTEAIDSSDREHFRIHLDSQRDELSRGLRVSELGLPIGATELYRNLLRTPDGTFVGDGPLDKVRRLTAYRTTPDFPLVISVGFAESDFLAGYFAAARRLYFAAALASGLVLLLALLTSWVRLQRERVQAELEEARALAAQKSRALAVTLDHMNQGIFMVDADGTVAVMNRHVVQMLDLPEEMLTSRPTHVEVLDFMWKAGEFGDDGQLLEPDVRDHIRSGAQRGEIMSYERVRPNGTILQIDTEYLAEGGLVRTITDITARKEAEARIARMALHDDLTDLPNRAMLNRQLDLAFARARRYGECFAVHCLDLDGFKRVNDTLGHFAGDLLLQEIADRLRACVRDLDTVARTGGDEFVIIQAAAEQEELAMVLADRVRVSIGRPFTIEGQEVAVAASIGIAFAPQDGGNPVEIVRNADLALYRAKARGRNQVCFFSEQRDGDMLGGRIDASPSLAPSIEQAEPLKSAG